MHRVVLLAITLLGLLASPLAAAPATFASGQGFRGLVAEGITDIDGFWSGVFRAAGEPYVPPTVVDLVGEAPTGCGFASGYDSPAFYCPLDGTIYYALWFLAEQEAQFGDYAWHNVLAHEWGHHVQAVLGLEPLPGNAFELQADCLAGAYARDAAGRGVLLPGDVTEAVLTSAAAGDDPFFPQDQPGAHGTSDDRVTAFMGGYLDGVGRCNLPLAPPTAPPAVASALTALLPVRGEVPRGLARTEEGARTEAEIVATFPDPAEAARRFTDWGWRENAYRTFAAPDGSGLIQASWHRFRTAAGAAAALPYFAAGRAAALGLTEVTAPPLGDRSAAVVGPVTDGYETTLYVQQGDLLLRLTAVAATGDPLPEAETVALALLAKAAGGLPAPPSPLASLLPTAGAVGFGLEQIEDGARGLDEVTASFPDPADAARRFADWGWRANAYRNFAAPAGGVTSVEISLHRFGGSAGAAAALPYFANGRAAVLGLAPVPVPGLADGTLAVGGPVAGGTEATVYVLLGEVLARVSVVAAAGDPLPVALDLADLVAAGAG